MFKTILAPIDGSDSATKAARTAAQLAQTFGSRLVFLHTTLQGEAPANLQHLAEVEHLVDIARPGPVDLQDVPTSVALALEEATRQERSHLIYEKIGRQILDSALFAAREAGVETVETRMVEGDPTAEILKAAEDSGAEVIVMGSRGLGELRGLLLGSVSQKVNAVAPCTCIVVK